jgi:glutamate-ammonia-ligase adenylyltransferase
MKACDTSDDIDYRVEQLRRSKNDLMLQILTCFLDGFFDQQQTEKTITELSEVTFNFMLYIYGLANSEESSPISILGMGRMAGEEMTFGSDLDLIFLYDDMSNEDYEIMARKVKLLLRSLSAVSSVGSLYEVDMRLRPHGTSGALLTSAKSFVEYHQENREVWERQMMTRCKVIIDNDRIGEITLNNIRPHIYQDYDKSTLAAEISTMRKRVEDEKGKINGKFNVKQGRGGLMDLDFFCHYYQLAYGHAHVELQTGSTRDALNQLNHLGRLADEDLHKLLDAYDFLKRLETCIRLFDMKPISTFSEYPSSNIALARSSGFADNVDAFMDTYKKVSNTVRDIFNEHLS